MKAEARAIVIGFSFWRRGAELPAADGLGTPALDTSQADAGHFSQLRIKPARPS
jgi:hypothetical protein